MYYERLGEGLNKNNRTMPVIFILIDQKHSNRLSLSQLLFRWWK